MFRKCHQLLKSFPKILPTHSDARKQEIDRIKADADEALTKFCNETTQFCIRKARAARS